jgi:hypothetical protein
MAVWILCLPLWLVGAVLVAGFRMLWIVANFVMPWSPDFGKFDWRGFPWLDRYRADLEQLREWKARTRTAAANRASGE